MKYLNSIFSPLLLILFGGNLLTAQTNFFAPVTAKNTDQIVETVKNIKQMNLLRLDEQEMRNYLLKAPMEFQNGNLTLPLEIPLPNGKTETFGMVESPNLAPEIAAQHPDIKSYTGNGLTHKEYIIRMNLTSLGFSAILLNVEGDAVYFEHFTKNDPDIYFSYFTKDAVAPPGSHQSICGIENLSEIAHQNLTPTNSLNNTGDLLTTFRLTMTANGEFTVENGGTQASGFAALTNYVNTINAIYRQELSVHLELVSGTNLVYDNPATDPYNNSEIDMIDDNPVNVDAVIGSGNYDVGHALGYDINYGSGGGVAYKGQVCQSLKAGGASIIGSGYAQVFYDQLILHELGHQFGMSHSYNSVIPVCTTRNGPTSVEPGAGATIMSYGFTCGSDDYPTYGTPGPILTFHSASYDEAIAYIATQSCQTTTATGNTPPVVTVPGAYTIPISTPFALTGSADAPGAGDSYSYSWEGMNIGEIVPNSGTLSNTAQPPFSRTYEPTTDPTRTFPLLSAILDGSNYEVGDKLSSVGKVLTYRLSVRDNNASGGGLSYGTVTVNGAIGPFQETTNLSGTFLGNSAQTITWDVNGTQVATPNVNILLSTDGGGTFPTVLASNTPNDGSESVTLPNIVTSTARIKVEAVGNIFFDISNNDFAINTVLPVELVNFEAALQNEKDALLQWQTASEVNSYGFEIEEANNQGSFEQIGFVSGKNNEHSLSKYTFVKRNLAPGVHYYRLKIMDNDGTFTFSPIKALTVQDKNMVMSLFPNPSSTGKFDLLLEGSSHQLVQVNVINSTGQIISSFDSQIENRDQLQLQMPTAGVYTVVLVLENGVQLTQRIVSLQ